MKKVLVENREDRFNLCSRILILDKNDKHMWELGPDSEKVPFLGIENKWHSHEEIEITLFWEGKGILSVGDFIGSYNTGECYIIGSNVPHHWKDEEGSSGIALQISLKQIRLVQAFGEFEDIEQLLNMAKYGLRISGITLSRLKVLMQSFELSGKLMRPILIMQMFQILLEGMGKDCHKLSSSLVPCGSDSNLQRIEKVVNYILNHFREPLPLSKVIEISGLSQASFARAFKNTMGISFVKYVNRLRCMEVKQYLLQSDAGILKLATDAGFNNLSNFNDVFKKEFGYTPSQYRKMNSPASSGVVN